MEDRRLAARHLGDQLADVLDGGAGADSLILGSDAAPGLSMYSPCRHQMDSSLS